MPAKPSLSGFDIKKLAAASGSPANDPWARREAWRSTGMFTRGARFRGMFPGFGLASVAFGVYLGYEYMFLQDEHGHGHGGGEPGAREGH